MYLGECSLCHRNAGPNVEFYHCARLPPCILFRLICGECHAIGQDHCPRCGDALELEPLSRHDRDMRNPFKRLWRWWQIRAERRQAA